MLSFIVTVYWALFFKILIRRKIASLLKRTRETLRRMIRKMKHQTMRLNWLTLSLQHLNVQLYNRLNPCRRLLPFWKNVSSLVDLCLQLPTNTICWNSVQLSRIQRLETRKQPMWLNVLCQQLALWQDL